MGSSPTLSPVPAPPLVPLDGEERLLVNGVDWRAYVLMRELLDSPGLRMTYLEGALELMTPSRRHERVKTTLARMLEVYALERDVPLEGFGSTTFRREVGERGLEPDECYTLGRDMPEEGPPDIALEVVIAQPLLDKLSVYAGLPVREVWAWEDGVFRLFAWRPAGEGGAAGYVEIAGSALLPGLDFSLLAEYADRRDQHAAVREYRDRLRVASGEA
jgi:Uma2 family endonuclease